MIGAPNSFGLALATAIPLYGADSAITVGVVVEFPVMPSVCRVCVATKHWFDAVEPQVGS